jgi:hypothetical protein
MAPSQLRQKPQPPDAAGEELIHEAGLLQREHSEQLRIVLDAFGQLEHARPADPARPFRAKPTKTGRQATKPV